MGTVPREYRCRSRRSAVAMLLMGGMLTIGMNMRWLLEGWYSGPFAASVFLGGVFVALGAWMAFQDVRRPRRIRLTDCGILVPLGWLPAFEISAPYSKIVRVWYREMREFRQIGIELAKERVILPPLQTKKDETEFLCLLGEQLEPFHVLIEARRSPFVNGRWRPQFSLVSMLVLTACVALLLGTWLHIGWEPKPRDMLVISYTGLFYAIPCVVLLFARARRGFAFAVGYSLGGAIAFVILQWLIPLAIATAIPFTGILAGWYPLAVPLQRWLATSWGVDSIRAIGYAAGADVLFASIVVGLASLRLSHTIEQIINRRLGTPTPPETCKLEEIL